MGIAPKDSKPVHKIELTKEKEAEIAAAQEFEDYAQSEASVPIDDEQAILDAAKNKNKPALRPHISK